MKILKSSVYFFTSMCLAVVFGLTFKFLGGHLLSTLAFVATFALIVGGIARHGYHLISYSYGAALIGCTCNYIALAANGARMPVLTGSCRDCVADTLHFATDSPNLPFFIDRLSSPLGSASIGDVFLALGALGMCACLVISFWRPSES